MVFVDLEKAYDRLHRKLIWWSLRNKGVPEAYIKIIQYMYGYCETQVTTKEGNTEYFNVKVGLYQASAISPLLFVVSASSWRRSEFGVRIIEYTAEYRRIDEYSFVIYNTCSIGACAYRVILDKL